MTWEINITLDSRHFDTFDVQAENEREAIERAREQLEGRIAIEANRHE